MQADVLQKSAQRPARGLTGARSQGLLAFLRSPSSYRHAPTTVRFIETHISRVFIASPFVFKVKKPVDLGFVNFSTLEKRQHFCKRECELNRRLCPDTYLDVVPIYQREQGFSFDPPGVVVEYAVKMRELEHGWFLHELLARNAVGENEINRVIDRLCRFYGSERPDPRIQRWGKPNGLKISTDENFSEAKVFVGRTISSTALEAVRHFTNGFYAAHNQLFESRVRQLRIRDCHGDLRVDHLHITPLATTIFDCVEFNDRLRLIDIANDVAFLAMDFDVEGSRELGDLFLQNVARELDDPGILKLANFYKCYRAFVRGKVESIQAQMASNSEEHARQAARYFHFALRYATVGSGPVLVAVMGRIATGKSTVAQQLGCELGWPVFSSDEIRKRIAGVLLKERTAAGTRARVYSEQMTKATYRALLEYGLAAARGCGGAILDATFSDPAIRRNFIQTSDAAGVRMQFVELDTDSETIRRRLKERASSRNEVSDARLEDFENLDALYVAPSELGPDLIKIASAGTMSNVVGTLLLRLAEKQCEMSR